MSRRYVLGYGLGVDSTAILLRWIYEPWSRPCSLDQLLVVTAMTGDEWPESGQLVTDHILPLLRQHGIRYVQLARSGPLKADGITVLSDSRRTAVLHLEGDYRLSQEMVVSGTVPQVGGIRKCSMKAKGEVIDRWLEGELDGAPFDHFIGFEFNEGGRALRDSKYNTEQRRGVYPLVEWGWDRSVCEAYITAKTGAKWVKSACTYCPFALANKDGQARVQEMFTRNPGAGVRALVMEYVSICLNPQQGLIKTTTTRRDGIRWGRLSGMLRGTGRHFPVLEAFREALEIAAWRIYEVQRVAVPTAADPSRGVWSRSVRSIAEGTRGEMNRELTQLALDEGGRVETDQDGISRIWMARRSEGFPAYERMYVVAPAGVADKETPAFRTALAAWRATA